MAWALSTDERVSRDGFETFLTERGIASEDQLEKARQLQNESGDSLCLALYRTGLISSRDLAEAVAAYHGVPLLDPEEWGRIEDIPGLSLPFLRDRKVCPIRVIDDAALFAMADPGDDYAINALRLAVDRPVRIVAAPADEIESAIERLSRDSEPGAWLSGTSVEEDSDDVQHLRDIALGTPVVRFVNQLLQDAYHSRATDIHIEPFQNRLVIRMRVDGMLRTVASPPPGMAKAIVSRIKILSGLNIAERRLPQDGRARVRIDSHRMDLRVATMPTIHGETVAIRLLDIVRRTLDFGKLGFAPQDEAVIRKHLAAPYGMFIVTGPTGSGKTTTLATALSLLNQSHRKILTIEDPIEYELEGVNQTQAKPSIGLTFASAMRSFLRHDPDVIMVGEMRDSETAGIAIHAALTGHLVLTTLHTNTAAGAIPRLFDMGVEPFLLASSLRCVIGQRLVRVLCNHCKRRDHAAAPGGGEGDWRAVGCERCSGTGFSDRIVIAEVLDVNDDVRSLIRPGMEAREIEKAAIRAGMTTMMEDGLRKCRAGLTTPEEVRRVALDI